MQYEEYLKTEHWKSCKQRALRQADSRCQVCNSTRNLNVHHNTYENLWYEYGRDLIVLCKKCHSLFHLPREPEEVIDLSYGDFWPVVEMTDGTIRKGPDATIIGNI